MFIWLQVHFESHPLFGSPSAKLPGGKVTGTFLSLAMMIFLTGPAYRVLVGLGGMFSATEEIRQRDGWRYVRLCFGAESEERNKIAAERFVDGVRRFWELTVEDIEELLDPAREAESLESEEEMEALNMGGYMGC